MTQFTVWADDAEVGGRVMLGFIQTMTASDIAPVINKYGLADAHPDKWYPMQTYLDALSEVAALNNPVVDLVSIGMAIVEAGLFPTGFESMSYIEVMSCWQEFYHLYNRGKGAGTIFAEIIDPGGHIRMVDCTPYPDDMQYGTLYGAASRFLPRSTEFAVFFDDHLPRKDEGARKTILHIRW